MVSLPLPTWKSKKPGREAQLPPDLRLNQPIVLVRPLFDGPLPNLVHGFEDDFALLRAGHCRIAVHAQIRLSSPVVIEPQRIVRCPVRAGEPTHAVVS